MPTTTTPKPPASAATRWANAYATAATLDADLLFDPRANCWAVYSPRSRQWYAVTATVDRCDCQAGRLDLPCWHCAKVRLYLGVAAPTEDTAEEAAA
jgi:hypothetical protein